ncbi:hypothetical protein [Conexibacter sp. CPCC 206217]|uniref:hypothetical protein n=1 Tax=Conexibacter sp. CPCC 206217 TaxID=3064574 RepID=UPI00272073D1|nr:hypothetical protein [Conexibacter sp. CPCC 206217]MDO8211630.1 hypothetical protein [Conexibacter sp. CPCC 206217]
MSAVPVGGVPLGAVPVGAPPLGGVPVDAAPLGGVPVARDRSRRRPAAAASLMAGVLAASLWAPAGVAPAGAAIAPEAWPGGTAVSIVDGSNPFGTDLSGLSYEAGATPMTSTLWAVRNKAGTLFKLRRQGGSWALDSGAGWSAGRSLGYPGASGGYADTEGIALTDASAAGGIYAASERSNQSKDVSRPSVLRYDVSGAGASLHATHEWNLRGDLPAVDSNSGLESIAWVPDADLTAAGFFDERTGRPYAPGDYPNHGAGLFFVGLEATGTIYAYALNHSSGGGFDRVAAIPISADARARGFATLMDLQWDADNKRLWAICDDHCGSRAATYEIAATGPTAGRFAITHVYDRPTGLPNGNTEGFAFAPESACVNGYKPVWWGDDGATAGHALREGTLACAAPAAEPEPDPMPEPEPGSGSDPTPEPDPGPEAEPTPEPEPAPHPEPMPPPVQGIPTPPILLPTPMPIPPAAAAGMRPGANRSPTPAGRSLTVRWSVSAEAIPGRRLQLRIAAKGVSRPKLNQALTVRVTGVPLAFSVRLKQGRATVPLADWNVRAGRVVSVTVSLPAFTVTSGTTTFRAAKATKTVRVKLRR